MSGAWFRRKVHHPWLGGQEIFYSWKEAQLMIEQWRKRYNTIRPHSSLKPSDPGPTDVCPNSIGLDRDHINAVGSHPLVHKIRQVNQPPLVPASTAVPTAATKQQNEKHNDEKRGGIHVRFPRNAAYCAAWNSGFLTTFSQSSGSRYPRGEMASL